MRGREVVLLFRTQLCREKQSRVHFVCALGITQLVVQEELRITNLCLILLISIFD